VVIFTGEQRVTSPEMVLNGDQVPIWKEAILTYVKVLFQHSREDSEKYKENLVTEESTPVDIRNLNLMKSCPLEALQEVIQRTVI
jgi:hypothetical protein